MRTKRAILNFITSFLPWTILAILAFLRVRLFISIYGSEMNGLLQLALQIFTYLGLMEAGFGAAVNYKLYKPLAENNRKKVSEIFCGAKKIFKKIGIFIFIGGLLTSLVAPLLIQGATFSYKFIFAIFFLFSVDYLIQYFLGLSYQTLMMADQKQYKINIIRQTLRVIFKGFEIFLIFQGVNYLLVLLISVIVSLVTNLLIIKKGKKEYPWLDENAEEDTSSLKMTKDVIIHKISGLIFKKTDIIVLSIFQGLIVGSIYSVYSFVVAYLEEFINYLFKSSKDSFGNLFVEQGKYKEKEKIFMQMLSVGIYFALVISITFINSIQKFVYLWINSDYILPFLAIILFGLNIFHSILIKPLHVVRNANGLYKETKGYTIVQAATNLILSLILAPFFGITGVVFATVFSQVIIANPFEVNIVYKNIFNKKVSTYYKIYFITIVSGVLLYFLNNIFINFLNLYTNISLLAWILQTGIIFTLNLCLVGVALWIISLPFKNFVLRIIFLRRKNNG